MTGLICRIPDFVKPKNELIKAHKCIARGRFWQSVNCGLLQPVDTVRDKVVFCNEYGAGSAFAKPAADKV